MKTLVKEKPEPSLWLDDQLVPEIGPDDRRPLLASHRKRFRAALEETEFRTLPGVTPIISVMVGEAKLAQDLAAALDARGVYVAGLIPVAPKGQARIRT
jgi:glycine C-acetyltransferase